VTLRTDSGRGFRQPSTASSDARQFQPFPTERPLRDQLDLSLRLLGDLIAGRFPGQGVYPYVVASVRQGPDGRFRQTGCSPNIQGGVITLCNCKHQMRTYAAFHEAAGVWIAGLTGGRLTRRHRRYLFYLMFARPVQSQAEMWRDLPQECRDAKAATTDRFGEIYPPRLEGLVGQEAFDPGNYMPPMAGHVHSHNWQRDLTYATGGRHPALMLGDATLSFIWSRPRRRLRESSSPLPRNPVHSENIRGFLDRLSDEEQYL
jgi:hypothetical protein